MAASKRDKQASAATLLLPTALFALHTFLLMGTGVWNDFTLADEPLRIALYYTREGMLVAGFVLYAAIAQWRRDRPLTSRAAAGLHATLAVLFTGCVLLMQAAPQSALYAPAMLAVALMVGVIGAMTYLRIAKLTVLSPPETAQAAVAGKAESRMPRPPDDAVRPLGLVVGLGGSLAVLVQYFLQIQFSFDWLVPALFVICFAVLLWLLHDSSQQLIPERDATAELQRDRSTLTRQIVFTTVIAACLFALFPFYEIVMRDSLTGVFFYKWHRLFLIGGYLMIGAAAFFGGRPASALLITVTALFSVLVLTQAATLQVGNFTAVLFYVLLGAVIAWSGISFMSAAQHASHPALVASMGRILESLITIAGSLIPLGGQLSTTVILFLALALLAVVIVCMVQGGFFVFSTHGSMTAQVTEDASQDLVQDPAPSIEDRLRQTAGECGLTKRESEVLAALVTTEKINQQIADDLGISRRQLQNHIARIYEKTNTKTRAGLAMRVNGNDES